ncbi:Cys/Met metabolism PLP-dependent enzyme-domain-containing protein [Phlyctochytrium arcticum]|nr:Cys/Met metabolism PLP-dependent enzyme-domain-containing protein [Phlyctochytrium arcticum]
MTAGKNVEGRRPATLAIHADPPATTDVAPPIHVATTFRYASDWNDRYAVSRGWLPKVPAKGAANGSVESPKAHIYSRMSNETGDRLETVLGTLEGGYAVTYGSGLAAVTAALTHVCPSRIVMSQEGYHGVHGAIDVYRRGRNVELLFLEKGEPEFKAGDLIWLESPQNPRGEVYDIAAYAAKTPSGATLAVDSTFAPPPLQKCLTAGAHIVMHSSTKFYGGHSDLLGGILVVGDEARAKQLRKDRENAGNVMGNLEAWLLLRSLRSLAVRVRQQSASAVEIARWLHARDEPATQIVERVWHGSIPGNPGHDIILKQGEGYSGVMSIEFKSLHHARLICSNLDIIVNATSLGGCESLIEWRVAGDPKITPTLVRFSVGLEDVEDLKDDLRRAMLKVAKWAQEFDQ